MSFPKDRVMWRPTDEMVSMMYGQPELDLYDCRPARE
jgi:hypothetical protein